MIPVYLLLIMSHNNLPCLGIYISLGRQAKSMDTTKEQID